MSRRLQASLVLGLCLVCISAWAEEPSASTENARAPEEPPTAQPAATATPPPTATPQPALTPPPTTPTSESSEEEEPAGWHIKVTGYFRAPISMGISSRPGPDDQTGPSKTQVSYGPNRVLDWNYYSFAYTRLQEQDWAELFVHEKKKHVDAVVGWMGYWYQSAGFRNPDAAWTPGMAYLTLDTDIDVGHLNPNIEATLGAWWPKFGYFEKYDTYTLGRFRQIGEQLKLTVPINPDLTAALVEGFGTNRDGSFNYLAPPFYGAIVGLDLLTWWNLELTYKKYVDIGFHYNTEWTADPNLEPQNTLDPKSYQAAQQAHLTVAGMEANLSAPRAGHLWISPSYISVRNGWALSSGGTEVMHSLGGSGVASNYLAWNNTPSDSTGTGAMFNLGFLYENTISGCEGKPRGSVLPDLAVSLFGLYTSASLDLPAGSKLTQTRPDANRLRQFKYGVDATLQATDWVGFMLRGDLVDYDLDHPAYIFAALTGRVIFASHFLSRERMYVQYSRYVYGDKMLLNGVWPSGEPLVAGSNVLQEGPYSGKKPDQSVVKLQAEIAF
jgi:hypothetical protein